MSRNNTPSPEEQTTTTGDGGSIAPTRRHVLRSTLTGAGALRSALTGAGVLSSAVGGTTAQNQSGDAVDDQGVPIPNTDGPYGIHSGDVDSSANWTLDAGDDFTGTLSSSNWSSTFGWGNSHDRTEEYCRDGTQDAWVAPNLQRLVLKTEPASDAPEGKTWYGGAANTLGSVEGKYGFWEACIRPAVPVRGFIPGFWSRGTAENGNGPWPPEIDFMERFGEDPTGQKTAGTVHWVDETGEQRSDDVLVDHGVYLSVDFHVYGCYWSPEGCWFYFDGNLMAESGGSDHTTAEAHGTSGQHLESQDHYAIFSNHVWPAEWNGQPNMAANYPVYTQMDWFRRWEVGEEKSSAPQESTAPVAAVRNGWGEPVAEMSSDFRQGSLEGKWGDWGDGEGCTIPDTWNGRRCGSNSEVRDGMHVIEGTTDGASGGATSTQTFTYGRIEIRERAYTVGDEGEEAYNVVPLIYPRNPDSQIAADGEIDFAERQAGDPAFFVIHWGGENYYINIDIDSTKWHNYAIEWLPDEITWYVDGQEVGSFDLSLEFEAEYNAGQLDMTVEEGTPMKHTVYEIDWIKFYQHDASGKSPVPENDHTGGTDWKPTNVRQGKGWQGD